MRTIAALALLFSAQAFACPNLTGSFTCSAGGKSEVMDISQDTKAGVTVYTINGEAVPADNQVRTLPDSAEIKNATMRVWCDDDVTLKSQILGKYYNGGSYFGDLTANIFFKMNGSDLKQDVSGDVKSGGRSYPINQTIVCRHN